MRFLSPCAWILFALAGALSWLVDGGILIRAIPPDLERLPGQLASFTLGEEIAVEPGALGDLPPDRYAYRRIADGAGNEGVLFVAYYLRSRRWSGRPHDVQMCYRSLGWKEREARPLEPNLWSRRFERDGRTIRVVHWLEHPGPEVADSMLGTLARRALSPRGLRPDVASIYLEFDELDTPCAADDAAFAAAARDLSAALERSWR